MFLSRSERETATKPCDSASLGRAHPVIVRRGDMRIAICVVTVSLFSCACGGDSADSAPETSSSTIPQQSVTAGAVGSSTAVGGAAAPVSSTTPTAGSVTTTPPAAPVATPPSTATPAGPVTTATAGAAAPAAGAAGGASAGARASAPATPSAGAGGAVTAAAPATGPGACPAGEMCQVSTVGGFKFCAPMMQPLPPSCTGANAPCGSDMKGMCLDAAAIGFTGTFCLHNTCM